MKRLSPSSSLLLIIDVQEKLAAAMHEASLSALERATHVLLEGAQALSVPVLVTEQYPQGLGRTLPKIADKLEAVSAKRLEKLTFSAVEAPGFGKLLQEIAPRSVVVVGMEAHVCVFMTARELAARGLEVHVPMDGVASRREDHKATGLSLCQSAGATITTAETVVFDWLGAAGGEAFKRVSRAVR